MENIPGGGRSVQRSWGRAGSNMLEEKAPVCSQVREGKRRRRGGQGGNRESPTGPCGVLLHTFTPERREPGRAQGQGGRLLIQVLPGALWLLRGG